jgi:cell pole-organizing protein PopZ
MEEILASIRRIIADDEPGKDPGKPTPPAPKPVAAVPPPPPPAPEPAEEDAAAMGQDDIDALLSGFNDKPQAEPDLPSADVLELTEAVPMPAPPKVNGFPRAEPRPDVMFREPAPPPPPAPVMRAAPPPVQPPPVMEERSFETAIMSEATGAAVSAAFGSLTHTILAQNARTLEDIVKDMLRPMLKQWMDENLPTIVERLVRLEIERVSRGL